MVVLLGETKRKGKECAVDVVEKGNRKTRQSSIRLSRKRIRIPGYSITKILDMTPTPFILVSPYFIGSYKKKMIDYKRQAHRSRGCWTKEREQDIWITAYGSSLPLHETTSTWNELPGRVKQKWLRNFSAVHKSTPDTLTSSSSSYSCP